MLNFEYYFFDIKKIVENFVRKVDFEDFDKNSENFYINELKDDDGIFWGCFQFMKLCVYEMVLEIEFSYEMKYDVDVLFVSNDSDMFFL